MCIYLVTTSDDDDVIEVLGLRRSGWRSITAAEDERNAVLRHQSVMSRRSRSGEDIEEEF